MSEPEHLAIKVLNEPAEIPRVAGLVEAFCEKHGVAGKAVYHFNLAIDEALTNVMSYAHDDGAQHEIGLDIAYRGGDLIAVISDDGKPFDPLAQPVPDVDMPLDERKVGGLGIHLLRTLMTKAEYRRVGNRNQLTFSIRAKA